MITIIGALLGFLGANFPSFMNLFQDRQDKQHELDLMDRQVELQKQGYNQQLQQIAIQAESADMVAKQQAVHTGIGWVDAVNGTVRPFLVFSYMAIFWIAKVPKLIIGISIYSQATDMPIDNLLRILDLIWDDNDDGVMAAIVSFYFTSKYLEKQNNLD